MANAPPSVQSTPRVIALDAARGYAMFMLLLYMILPRALRGLADDGLVGILKEQLNHAAWHGLTFVDLGLPGFIHLVGMSIVYSLSSRLADSDKWPTDLKIAKRVIGLFLLGVLYNGGLSKPWPDVRLAGVLQRIAICYGAGALVFLHVRLRYQIALFLVILFGYWAMLYSIPVPGFGAANLSFEGNLAAYVDSRWLLGRAYLGTWDPEGLLTTLPAIATCLAGVFTGQFFRNATVTSRNKVLLSLLIGSLTALVGLAWMEWMPLNKYLWTPSFVMISECHALITFAVIYQLTDVWKQGKWCFPLVVIGSNPLLAYLAIGLLPFHEIATRIVGADLQAAVGTVGPLLVAAVELLLCWLMLLWFYKKGAFVKM